MAAHLVRAHEIDEDVLVHERDAEIRGLDRAAHGQGAAPLAGGQNGPGQGQGGEAGQEDPGAPSSSAYSTRRRPADLRRP